VSFLLMVFLTLVCLFNAYPVPWWTTSPAWSAAATWSVVALIGLDAWVIGRRVSRSLRREPARREAILTRYERWRFIHQAAWFVLYGLVLTVLGWGWAVRNLWWHPGVDLLTLAPFLAGQVLTWVFFYDADRAAHRAAHLEAHPDTPPEGDPCPRLPAPLDLAADPFAFTGLELRPPAAPSFGGRWAYVAFHLRQKLALVFIPVALLILLKELSELFADTWQQWQSVVNVAAFAALGGVFIGMPLLIRLVLGLEPLPAGPIRDRLQRAADRLGFRCSDILLWNTRNGMANAMVIGLVPWLRYVVFTDRLLEEFPEEEVEAVFGHEIGHIRHKHMVYYLIFLTLSMAVLGIVGEDYLKPLLMDVWNEEARQLPDVLPALAGKAQDNYAVFPIVGMVVAYIFLVFGFLSRRCERQADLYGCRAVSCGDPDCLEHAEEVRYQARARGLCATGIRTFIQALEKVAHVNGISRSRPGFLQSWQHSTIARRVSFLKRVLRDRRVESSFQRRLAAVKWGLLLALLAVLAVLTRTHWPMP
jgi:STE24 endopeptidase